MSSFDPNLRLNLWPDRDEMRAIVNTFAAHASVVMPGLGEGRLLTGHDDAEAIAKKYLDAGAREVKLGAEGAPGRRTDRPPDRGRSRLSRSTPLAPAMALPPATSPRS